MPDKFDFNIIMQHFGDGKARQRGNAYNRPGVISYQEMAQKLLEKKHAAEHAKKEAKPKAESKKKEGTSAETRKYLDRSEVARKAWVTRKRNGNGGNGGFIKKKSGREVD